MSQSFSVDFGYYPRKIETLVGNIRVTTRPDLSESIKCVSASKYVEKGWFYPGSVITKNSDGNSQKRPYSARIFEMPRTHTIEHAAADSQKHIDFHVWALSFFVGMRLTTTEMGFIDATPVEPGKLVDFVVSDRSIPKAIELAENFWTTNRADLNRAKLWTAALHALFIAQCPQSLQFERFIYLYTAIDACYALARSLDQKFSAPTHSLRIQRMCERFGVPIPDWVLPSKKKGNAEIVGIRNAFTHEALFMKEPFGFALHGVGSGRNLPLEMEHLICRFLATLLGTKDADYVGSPVTLYQTQGLSL